VVLIKEDMINGAKEMLERLRQSEMRSGERQAEESVLEKISVFWAKMGGGGLVRVAPVFSVWCCIYKSVSCIIPLPVPCQFFQFGAGFLSTV
jgi:hypothetical protein